MRRYGLQYVLSRFQAKALQKSLFPTLTSDHFPAALYDFQPFNLRSETLKMYSVHSETMFELISTLFREMSVENQTPNQELQSA